jgi:ATP-dependent Clp protease ATP-binding subunit ClpA
MRPEEGMKGARPLKRVMQREILNELSKHFFIFLNTDKLVA